MKGCCWRKKWDCLCRCSREQPRRAARKLGAWTNSLTTFSTTARKNTGSDCAPAAQGMLSKWLNSLGSSWKEPKRRIECFRSELVDNVFNHGEKKHRLRLRPGRTGNALKVAEQLGLKLEGTEAAHRVFSIGTR